MDLWIQGQHSLQSEFQSYTEKPCLNQTNKPKDVGMNQPPWSPERHPARFCCCSPLAFLLIWKAWWASAPIQPLNGITCTMKPSCGLRHPMWAPGLTLLKEHQLKKLAAKRCGRSHLARSILSLLFFATNNSYNVHSFQGLFPPGHPICSVATLHG
jgi:hypothetical protein